jgi:hypothetical protein
MLIREISLAECLRFLTGTRLARLACAHENQPYIVPVYLAYHRPLRGEACLYGFTTPGQKIAWMRSNPLVCVEVEEVTAYDRWVSVIASGRYEELPDVAGRNGERLLAHEILQAQAIWWEPASSVYASRIQPDAPEPFIPVFYKIRIDHITGHEATQDPREVISDSVAAPPAGRLGRLGRALSRVFGG